MNVLKSLMFGFAVLLLTFSDAAFCQKLSSGIWVPEDASERVSLSLSAQNKTVAGFIYAFDKDGHSFWNIFSGTVEPSQTNEGEFYLSATPLSVSLDEQNAHQYQVESKMTLLFHENERISLVLNETKSIEMRLADFGWRYVDAFRTDDASMRLPIFEPEKFANAPRWLVTLNKMGLPKAPSEVLSFELKTEMPPYALWRSRSSYQASPQELYNLSLMNYDFNTSLSPEPLGARANIVCSSAERLRSSEYRVTLLPLYSSGKPFCIFRSYLNDLPLKLSDAERVFVIDPNEFSHRKFVARSSSGYYIEGTLLEQ